MDKNTVTGIILIFLIFIGFSIYNNSRLNKAYKAAIAEAEASIAKGDSVKAREDYIKAINIKPNLPEARVKFDELNRKLGLPAPEVEKDSALLKPESAMIAPAAPAAITGNASQYGPFADVAIGENDFITLENDKIELKISLKGGRVYSARLKDYMTYDSLPLILFSGDSTIFGFNFLSSISYKYFFRIFIARR